MPALAHKKRKIIKKRTKRFVRFQLKKNEILVRCEKKSAPNPKIRYEILKFHRNSS